MGVTQKRRQVREASESMEGEDQVAETNWPLLTAEDCGRHLSEAVIAAYPAIVAGFVEQAKGGSCQHLKVATEIVEASRERRSQEKGPAELLLEKYSSRFGFEVDEAALSN